MKKKRYQLLKKVINFIASNEVAGLIICICYRQFYFQKQHYKKVNIHYFATFLDCF